MPRDQHHSQTSSTSSALLFGPDDRTDVPIPPIDRLPSELLSIIFALTLDGNSFSPEHIFRAIALSHVSRYWRQASLDASTLWTLVDLRYPTIGREFCARSRSSPIRVTFTPTCRNDVRAFSAQAEHWLSAHMQRVESIYLFASQSMMRTVLALFGTAIPQLLDLASGLHSSTRGGPSLLVELRSARLHRICFDDISFNGWNRRVSFPASLRKLTLSRLYTSFCPSVPDVLSILNSCPILEEFALVSALREPPHVIDGTFVDLPVVELPHLKLLELGTRSRVIMTQILSHLSIPATTTIFLHSHGVTDLSAVIPADLSRLRIFSLLQYRSMSFHVTLQISTNGLALINHADPARASVRFAVSPEALPQILENAASISYILSGVTALQIVAPNGSTPSVPLTPLTCKRLFACLPRLMSIEVGGSATESLVSFLQTLSDPTVSSSTPRDRIPCRRLQTMRILDRWRDGRHLYQHLLALEQCLTVRASALNAPLASLDFEILQEFTRETVSSFRTRLRTVTKRVRLFNGGVAPLLANTGTYPQCSMRQ
ncbi:uncharacterized protein FIBRA_05644 [Fibroporia radiculosa]|uniref:Uncharacterized protein n=1 Tax=Fibroporia radiculosa TaxID=599839 RepID=J4GRD7_9APHY|nr:uncharacterized protein FIBRA_05644 [Fibroporia radiculosa]CCM03510.1 predicted protein [Fibroporia radiculosa]